MFILVIINDHFLAYKIFLIQLKIKILKIVI